MNYHLKRFPEDFYVVESLVVPITNSQHDNFHYYSLSKKNISTFDAIRILSSQFDIDVKLIGYAGLKDEDGITTQTISSPKKLFNDKNFDFLDSTLNIPNCFMKLHYMGSGNVGIRIGRLSGNSFRITIRGISKALADAFSANPKFTNYFVNYYGPQRFGLPNEIKNTHVIGNLLHKKEYSKALKLLSKQKSFIGEKAKSYKGRATNFFYEIDERQLSFFLNSFESFNWNQTLIDTIQEQFNKNTFFINNAGLDFLYFNNCSEPTRLLSFYPVLPYKKTFYSNGVKTEEHNKRNTVIQVELLCDRIFSDSNNELCCDISFFLPSGSYATVAIDQVIHNTLFVINKDATKSYEVITN
jgi:tRNA pseudouridine13 synthase